MIMMAVKLHSHIQNLISGMHYNITFVRSLQLSYYSNEELQLSHHSSEKLQLPHHSSDKFTTITSQ